MLKMCSASLLVASLAVPAFAQNPASPSANHSTAGMAAPATRDTAGNPTDNGGIRASKIVGSSVYND